MTASHLDRRGVALAVAVYALVVVMALVGAVFMVATTEQRMAESMRGIYRSFALAEAGAYETIAAWNQPLNALQTYPRDSILLEVRRAPLGPGSFSGTVRRLNADLFLIVVSGTAVGGVQSRVGVLVRQPAAVQDCDTNSNCSVDNDLQELTSPAPLRSRGWSYLF